MLFPTIPNLKTSIMNTTPTNHTIKALTLLFCLGLSGFADTASAATRNWVAATDGDFSDTSKWSSSLVPGVNDVAQFFGSPEYPADSSFTVTLTGNVVNQFLRTDGDNPYSVTLDLAGYNYTAALYTDATNSTVVARGSNDKNTLNIVGSGTFSSNGFSIATNATARGSVAVSGTGTELSVHTNETLIGSTGTGSMAVSNGGKLTTSTLARIGRASGSVGTVLISGGTWAASHEVQVASFNATSSGSLTVEDGGQVTLTTTSQNGWLSFGALGTATALITGAGSEVSAVSTIAIGGRGNNAGGNAQVTVEDGGKLITTAALNIHAPGSLSVEDALVSAGSLGNATAAVAGNISLTLSGLNALMDVSGDVFLNSSAATLTLSLQTGASYAVNDVIRLIEYGGTLSGAFVGITNGQELTFGGYDFEFSYGTGSDSFMSLTVVPEPSTASLLALFALTALSCKRRRS